MQKKSAAPFLPKKINLSALKKAVQGCRGCDLYKNATQAVFGEGRISAKIVFIGEQPGDKEDIEGHPFVGPAGQLLDKALVEAGIDRRDIYVTNAVKHFKWERQGKRRLHGKPNTIQIRACKPWLEAELSLIKPEIIVCLGATAAYSIFGKAVKIKDMRGKFHSTAYSPNTFVTSHPSAILRQREHAEREQAYRNLVKELKLLKTKLT